SVSTSASESWQQTQPPSSSTNASPPPPRIARSMPSAPNSLEITATRSACARASSSRWRTTLVLPEPRNPETISTGMRSAMASENAGRLGCRAMEALLRAVREACDARTWSRGVELARQQVVSAQPPENGSLRLEVAARGLRAARVRLWPDAAEWDCDCDAPADACEHVAAAAIALRQAREQGKALPVPGPSAAPGRVVYRFRSEGDALALGRAIAHGATTHTGQELPLRGSVAALAAGRGAGPALAASEADLRIDELLRGRDGPIPPGL